MFYSHEILTSRQYGVATIWLVATTGNKSSSTRKVTRKAIQEVDVRRACGKILEPGAPIALRLQGNLLYGVSCVYNQQYTYLVTDAKKTQDQMRFFFKTFSGDQLDPEAGRTRPENILIGNDPAFDPKMPLPQFELETLIASQTFTQKTSSQMSPQSFQSPGQGFTIQLDIGHSSSSGYHGSPFGLEGLSSAQKPDGEPLILHQDDDVFGTQGDWGLEIDENGNIVESAEPQLPPLPSTRVEDNVHTNLTQFNEQPVLDDQGDMVMQEDMFPEVEPFPGRQVHASRQNNTYPTREAPSRGKKKLQMDEEIQLSRNVLRGWQSHYLDHCGGYQARRPATTTQVKRNAKLLTFGLGIGNIGQYISVPGLIHPLAVEFSGDMLFTTVTGIKAEGTSGRRRTASEAIEDDGQREEGRRVRPRLMENEENEQARAFQEDGFMNLDDPFADGIPQEVGREAEHPMSDHLSSTLFPWNRGSSAVPGSSIRAPNATQQGRDLSSPLGKRGDQDFVRYSDDALMGDFGNDGNFGVGDGFGSADSSFDGMQALDFGLEGRGGRVGSTAEEIQAQNGRLYEQLDKEGYDFMNFIKDAANKDGERRRDEDFDLNRKWLAFGDLFVPRMTPRSTAAQAFYHTLCLVTKGKMCVEQDGADQRPFGAIWIGANVFPGID